MRVRVLGLATLLGVVAWCQPARPAEVVVRWEPVTQDVEGAQEVISHYLLHYGRSPRPTDVVHPGDGTFRYESVINAGNRTEHRFEDLKPATWFFAVAAVDADGNLSAYSSEVRLGVPDEKGQTPPARKTERRSDATAKQPTEPDGCATAGGRGLFTLLLGLLLGGRRLRRQVHRPGPGTVGRPRQA